MQWRAHLIIGAVLAALVFWFLGAREPVPLALASGFGALCALVPDLDHDSSKGRKMLDSAVIAFALLAVYLGGCGGDACVPDAGQIVPMAVLFFAIVGAYFVLFRVFKPRHRGITHTIFACAVFGTFLFFLLGERLALAGILGYFSHLVADNHVKLV
ncbi:MAG: metal-dependent hydrolase [Candidatus Micrarchaeota archaeon]